MKVDRLLGENGHYIQPAYSRLERKTFIWEPNMGREWNIKWLLPRQGDKGYKISIAEEKLIDYIIMEYLKNHVRMHSFSVVLGYSESLFQISHTSRCYSISESKAAPHDFVFVNNLIGSVSLQREKGLADLSKCNHFDRNQVERWRIKRSTFTVWWCIASSVASRLRKFWMRHPLCMNMPASLIRQFGSDIEDSKLVILTWKTKLTLAGSGRLQAVDETFLKDLVRENPRVTVRELDNTLHKSVSTVHDHLKKLGFLTRLDVWVPHEMSE